MTIDDVHLKTGVSMIVLESLEAGNYRRLEPVFMRMGLRTYAQFLNMSGRIALAAYDEECGLVQPPDPSSPPPLETIASEPSPRNRISHGQIRPEQIRLGIVSACVVLFVLVVVGMSGDDEERASAPTSERSPDLTAITASENEPDVPPAAPDSDYQSSAQGTPVSPPKIDENTQVVAEAASQVRNAVQPPVVERSPEPPATAVDSTAPPASTAIATLSMGADPAVAEADATEPTVTGSDSSLTMRIEAVSEVWLQVAGDDRILFEGTVESGFNSGNLKAGRYFSVVSGKPHGLRYWFQGKLLGNEGRLGDANGVLRFRANRSGVELIGQEPPLRVVESAVDTLR